MNFLLHQEKSISYRRINEVIVDHDISKNVAVVDGDLGAILIPRGQDV